MLPMMTEEEIDIRNLESFIQDTSARAEDGPLTADGRICTYKNCGNQYSTFEEGCNMFLNVCPSCYDIIKAEAIDENGIN
jgi:hypothetical protein